MFGGAHVGIKVSHRFLCFEEMTLAELGRFFGGSIAVTILGLIAAYFIGGVQTVFIVAVLAVLEISLSFDNAIVNATVLKDMAPRWRKRFLTWGIVIAVFGMRVIFPLLIVSVVSTVNPIEALDLAINTPQRYADTVASANVSLMAFGGCFLMMVGLGFFLDEEKKQELVRSGEDFKLPE